MKSDKTVVEQVMKARPGGLWDHLQTVVGYAIAVIGAYRLGGLDLMMIVGGIIGYADIRIDDFITAIATKNK